MSLLVAAIDLGGTRCKSALVASETDSQRVIETLDAVDVLGLSGDAALDVIASLIRRMPTAGAVGLAIPGLHDAGVVTSLPGKFPGLEGVNVREVLSASTGLPITTANDAIAAAIGEATAGSLSGVRCGVMVTIGTGVGTALVLDGVPVGHGPQAGGILGGQIPISEPTGPMDTAGNMGTIEARCSARQILAHALEAGANADTVEQVVALARAGDVAALTGIAAWQGWLVRGLLALAHAHGPDVIAVGGGPIGDGELLLHGVDLQLRSGTWPGYSPRVVPAALGDEAALVGIAHLAGLAIS